MKQRISLQVSILNTTFIIVHVSHLIHDFKLNIIQKHVIHISIVMQFNQSKQISEQYDLIISP